MTGRVPVFPTILVVAAAAIMVALGFWQLGRMDDKAALIESSEAAARKSGRLAWSEVVDDPGAAHYRRTTAPCARLLSLGSRAGRNSRGQSGWAHIATCDTGFGDIVEVALGWSRDPSAPDWEAAPLVGTVTGGVDGPLRVTAEKPPAGLTPLARPDPADLPNNHLAYAGQWFFFAITALAIYWLALRRKWREQDRASRTG